MFYKDFNGFSHGRGVRAMRGHGGGRHDPRHADGPSGRHRNRHGRFGRHGGGGGRIFGPGDLRLILLSLIAEKGRHGYELIKDLESQFAGAYSPSPGSVYPTLTLLEELGYVRSAETEGTKRLFEVTPEGSQYLRDNDAALASVRARMELAARAVAGEVPPDAVHHAMHTLRAALDFHRGGWDAAEVERVRKIIEQAATDISQAPADG